MPTETKTEKIDLGRFVGQGEIVLSGRPKGEELRQRLGLDQIEGRADVIQFTIPQQVVSLNSSFFLGLFADSVKKLGEAGFRSKYSFEYRPIVRKDIEAGITQALNTSNPLAAAKK